MSFQWQELHLREAELEKASVGTPDAAGFSAQLREPKPIAPARSKTLTPEPLPPFSDHVEIDCQDCGGHGYDLGGLNPREPEECSACHGSGKETILRNYLAEAFRIAADPEANLQLERAHLVALTTYARQTVSALMSLPEVA